jgi:hypothetical protein
MAVDRPIVKGQPFQVSFTGQLSELRGGYLFVRDMNGEAHALLWDDSLAEAATTSTALAVTGLHPSPLTR